MRGVGFIVLPINTWKPIRGTAREGGEGLFDLIRKIQENRLCVSVGGGFETSHTALDDHIWAKMTARLCYDRYLIRMCVPGGEMSKHRDGLRLFSSLNSLSF